MSAQSPFNQFLSGLTGQAALSAAGFGGNVPQPKWMNALGYAGDVLSAVNQSGQGQGWLGPALGATTQRYNIQQFNQAQANARQIAANQEMLKRQQQAMALNKLGQNYGLDYGNQAFADPAEQLAIMKQLGQVEGSQYGQQLAAGQAPGVTPGAVVDPSVLTKTLERTGKVADDKATWGRAGSAYRTGRNDEPFLSPLAPPPPQQQGPIAGARFDGGLMMQVDPVTMSQGAGQPLSAGVAQAEVGNPFTIGVADIDPLVKLMGAGSTLRKGEQTNQINQGRLKVDQGRLAESSRHNKASEGLAGAKLLEERRQFDKRDSQGYYSPERWSKQFNADMKVLDAEEKQLNQMEKQNTKPASKGGGARDATQQARINAKRRELQQRREALRQQSVPGASPNQRPRSVAPDGNDYSYLWSE